jgi:hypothetical protein
MNYTNSNWFETAELPELIQGICEIGGKAFPALSYGDWYRLTHTQIKPLATILLSDRPEIKELQDIKTLDNLRIKWEKNITDLLEEAQQEGESQAKITAEKMFESLKNTHTTEQAFKEIKTKKRNVLEHTYREKADQYFCNHCEERTKDILFELKEFILDHRNEIAEKLEILHNKNNQHKQEIKKCGNS